MRQSSLDRYQNDHAFAQLVNMIYALLCENEFTPSEIREAAMVAAMKQEMLSVRQVVLTREEYDRLRPDIREILEKH